MSNYIKDAKKLFLKSVENGNFIILSILTTFAFLLRLYHLGYHDFWYDEIITLDHIHHFNFIKSWNPPLYYAIIAGWVKIFGFSEVSLRFPSLLFSVACVPIIFLLGKELFNKSVGLYASAIMALSPFQLWYAQEARPYAVMLFFGLFSTYMQFLFIKYEKKKFLYWYLIFSVLGIYTHPYYIFFIITQFICCLIYFNKKWSTEMLIIFLLIPGFFILLIQKFCVMLAWVLKGYWIPSPSWQSFLVTIENFNLGYNSHMLTYRISALLSLILFIVAVWHVKQRGVLRKSFIFCLIFFALPLLLASAFSKLVVPIYFDRGLIISTPYYYLILGLGISAFRKNILKFPIIISIFLLLILSIYGFYKDWMPLGMYHRIGVPSKKPVKPIAEFIKKNSGINDIVAFTNRSIMLPFLWYSLGEQDFFIICSDKNQNDLVPSLRRYRFLFGPSSVGASYKQPTQESKFNMPLYKINRLEFEKLWVLSCDWQRDGTLDKNSLEVKKQLDKDFNLELEREFDGLWVYRYTK